MKNQIRKIVKQPMIIIVIIGFILVVMNRNTAQEIREVRNQFDIIQKEMEEIKVGIEKLNTEQTELESDVYTNIEMMERQITNLSEMMNSIVLDTAIPFN